MAKAHFVIPALQNLTVIDQKPAFASRYPLATGSIIFVRKPCGLAGLLVNFLALYEGYQNEEFLSAAACANLIARRISLKKAAFDEIDQRMESLNEFGANLSIPDRQLLGMLKKGIKKAHEQREVPVEDRISPPDQMTFHKLEEIAKLPTL